MPSVISSPEHSSMPSESGSQHSSGYSSDESAMLQESHTFTPLSPSHPDYPSQDPMFSTSTGSTRTPNQQDAGRQLNGTSPRMETPSPTTGMVPPYTPTRRITNMPISGTLLAPLPESNSSNDADSIRSPSAMPTTPGALSGHRPQCRLPYSRVRRSLERTECLACLLDITILAQERLQYLLDQPGAERLRGLLRTYPNRHF